MPFALDFAARHGLKLILSGGADAWRVADTLRERQVPVIIDGLLRLPMRRDDPPDALFSLPAKLAAAGVRYCIADGGRDSTNTRNLPFEAAHARAFGLSDDEFSMVVRHLGREPNALEAAMFGALWSEHCGYKNSRPLLKTLPTRGEAVLQGPGENAGVIAREAITVATMLAAS